MVLLGIGHVKAWGFKSAANMLGRPLLFTALPVRFRLNPKPWSFLGLRIAALYWLSTCLPYIPYKRMHLYSINTSLLKHKKIRHIMVVQLVLAVICRFCNSKWKCPFCTLANGSYILYWNKLHGSLTLKARSSLLIWHLFKCNINFDARDQLCMLKIAKSVNNHGFKVQFSWMVD